MTEADAQRIAASCVCLSVRALARLLSNRYEEALRPVGLTMAQFTLLTYLRAIGPQRITALAGIMELDQTTVSRNVLPLQRDGYVKAIKEGRTSVVALTKKGGTVLDRAYPIWEAAHRATSDAFGGEAQWAHLRGRIAEATGRL